MTSKLAAGFEIALGVHISPDKIDIVIETAKLWAGPVICAIFAVRSDAIVDRFKSHAPNVDPVFVPPSSDSDHVYVASRMRAPELIFRHHSSIISCALPSVFFLHFCQIPRESSASSCNGPLPRYFLFPNHVWWRAFPYFASSQMCIRGSHNFDAGHWIFFAIDVDFVPSSTLYNSLAANRDWLLSVAPSGLSSSPPQ